MEEKYLFVKSFTKGGGARDCRLPPLVRTYRMKKCISASLSYRFLSYATKCLSQGLFRHTGCSRKIMRYPIHCYPSLVYISLQWIYFCDASNTQSLLMTGHLMNDQQQASARERWQNTENSWRELLSTSEIAVDYESAPTWWMQLLINESELCFPIFSRSENKIPGT